MSKTVHLIPHTHWDYEWYFTHPESSVQLVYHMDDLFEALESGRINQYVLDGQLSIIEDYLALVPENRSRLQHWVTCGKLKIGPWYTQCDQLIISGESIVRNLLLGIRTAQTFGGSWMMGYVPDAFGQSIDMPKIYAGFGIKHSVFWRGLSDDKYPWREFNWRSEDGSQVQCYQLRNGYYLAEPQICGQAPDQIVALLSQQTRSDHIPFPYGADQIKVDMSLPERLAGYNHNSHQQHHFIESNYDDLFHAIDHQLPEMETIEGEMIDAQFSKIHRSIYSTRSDHKQYNDHIETRLTLVLEPLMVLADQCGIAYKQSLINNIWKDLVRNHAHDSAGGCNSDRTNRHILQRLITADQMSTAHVDFLVRKMAESFSSTTGQIALILFNTLPYARKERTVIELDTEQPGFTLSDSHGNPVDFAILHTEKRYRGSIKRDAKEHDPTLYYFHHRVEMIAELPAMGWCDYQLKERQERPAGITAATLSSQGIENARYRITLQNGKLSLTDQETISHWPDFLSIRDMGDDGDNYDYSPPEQDWIIDLDFSKGHSSVRTTPLSQTLTIKGNWLLPATLEERRQRRASVSQAYRLILTLSDGEPLQIDLQIDNRACDHRMQLVIESDILVHSQIADTPFGTVTRPHLHPRILDWQEKKWKEEPSCIYPMLHHVSLAGADKTLTLFACGIKEYEVIQPESPTPSGHSGTLAVTLFRSVGWLGKPDLRRRPGIASGQQFKYIPTPDSQLLQRLDFCVGLDLNPHFDPAMLMRHWQRFAVPPLSYQQQQLNRFTNTMKYFGVNEVPGLLPQTSSLFTVQAPKLVCSAIKQAESGEGLIIRLYNPASTAIEQGGEIHTTDDIKQVAQVNLNEETLDIRTLGSTVISLGYFAPKQIKTFQLFF
jgi:mannosylglycerate hydrolase